MEMNRTIIILVIAVMAIAVVAAGALLLTNNGHSDEDKTPDKPSTPDTPETKVLGNGVPGTKVTSRLLVYGNADNNDKLDQNDVKAIEGIMKSGEWNKDKQPFADANADGYVGSDDVSYLKGILEKNSTRLYYLNYYGNINYVNYPVTGSIAVNYSYGALACETIGIYDRITAGIDSVISLDASLYPGCDRLGAFSEDGVAFDNRMKVISDSVGVPFSNHTLRRTFGRTLFSNGVKLEDIAAILWHKDTKTTLRYLGLDRVDHSSHMNMLDFGDDEDD